MYANERYLYAHLRADAILIYFRAILPLDIWSFFFDLDCVELENVYNLKIKQGISCKIN